MCATAALMLSTRRCFLNLFLQRNRDSRRCEGRRMKMFKRPRSRIRQHLPPPLIAPHPRHFFSLWGRLFGCHCFVVSSRDSCLKQASWINCQASLCSKRAPVAGRAMQSASISSPPCHQSCRLELYACNPWPGCGRVGAHKRSGIRMS